MRKEKLDWDVIRFALKLVEVHPCGNPRYCTKKVRCCIQCREIEECFLSWKAGFLRMCPHRTVEVWCPPAAKMVCRVLKEDSSWVNDLRPASREGK